VFITRKGCAAQGIDAAFVVKQIADVMEKALWKCAI
jgi:hypothetical protein